MISYPNTRMRRNRKAAWSRQLIAENVLTPADLILPMFVQEGENLGTELKSMPGIERVSIDLAVDIARQAYTAGIPVIALFPYVGLNSKNTEGDEALNPDNLICRAVKSVKAAVPDIGVMVDIALDPYTTHGHDGLVDASGHVLNDETLSKLCHQALNCAAAGCDIVAPSDMMDGRIASIRRALEEKGYHNVQIISYAAKYASNFYGPFRDVVGSKVLLQQANKKTYQMDYANSDEALQEIELDISEGADVIIVKPGLPYLDIIRRAKDRFLTPIIAYQVSGEYAMMKLAAQNGVFEEYQGFFETLIAFKRAGASAIMTYAALEMAKQLAIWRR